MSARYGKQGTGQLCVHVVLDNGKIRVVADTNSGTPAERISSKRRRYNVPEKQQNKTDIYVKQVPTSEVLIC